MTSTLALADDTEFGLWIWGTIAGASIAVAGYLALYAVALVRAARPLHLLPRPVAAGALASPAVIAVGVVGTWSWFGGVLSVCLGVALGLPAIVRRNAASGVGLAVPAVLGVVFALGVLR